MIAWSSQNDKAFRARHRIKRKLIAETQGEEAARIISKQSATSRRV